MQLTDQFGEVLEVATEGIITRRVGAKILYFAPGAICWTESRSDAEQFTELNRTPDLIEV